MKKLLSFMGSELKFGDTIVVRVEGKDEAECAETVKKVFEENL